MQLHQRKRSKLSLDDIWVTPKKEVFVPLCEECDIYPILDVAALADNTKCPFYMTPIEDSLKTDWTIENSRATIPDYLKSGHIRKTDTYARWINPPNKYTQKYIIKSSEQFYKDNRQNMMLIPINATITKAGKRLVWYDDNVEIYPVVPTPKFINGDKQYESARNRYCVCIWRLKNGGV